VARVSTLLVWWGTSVECLSAIARRERDATLTPAAADEARRRLHFLREKWSEVSPSEQVRENAERALLRHPLRAADALQLGAALRWAENNPRGHRIHTLDARLTDAARKEGFELVDAATFGGR
jgi:predicted nucleic acid-binding protein